MDGWKDGLMDVEFNRTKDLAMTEGERFSICEKIKKCEMLITQRTLMMKLFGGHVSISLRT